MKISDVRSKISIIDRKGSNKNNTTPANTPIILDIGYGYPTTNNQQHGIK